MHLTYDINKLDDAMFNFNRATGVSITLYDTEGKPVTSKGIGSCAYCNFIATTDAGRRSCKRSNQNIIAKCRETKHIEKHICGAGLVDIAIPLLHNGEIVGYLMIGQIKQKSTLPDDSEKLDLDPAELMRHYEGIPLFDEEKIDSIINIGTMLTKYIMLENMVKSHTSKSAELISDYIKAHLSEKLTVEAISKATHLSCSGIYKCMHESYGKTLMEYISIKRVELAATLLEDGELCIGEIAEAVGFSDPAYFSRTFKRIRGISPIKHKTSFKSK